MAEREPVVLFVTAPSTDVAERIAKALVSEHLAACVNLLPGVRSLYEWQGEVHDDPEFLMVIKSCRDRVPELTARVIELHPYDVPEVVAWPLVGGFARYLDWVRSSTLPGGTP
jgi:periplasmic divalent cation tolerance protein